MAADFTPSLAAMAILLAGLALVLLLVFGLNMVRRGLGCWFGLLIIFLAAAHIILL